MWELWEMATHLIIKNLTNECMAHKICPSLENEDWIDQLNWKERNYLLTTSLLFTLFFIAIWKDKHKRLWWNELGRCIGYAYLSLLLLAVVVEEYI